MTKGKFGIYLWFYAVLAFILTFLGQTLLCGLLLGFVIVAEKNEWLSRQVMQAFSLSIAYLFLDTIISAVRRFFSNIFNAAWVLDSTFSNVFNSVFNVIEGLIAILVLVLVIMAIIKVSKQQEANLPLLGTLANKAFGIVEQKVYSQMPPQNPQNPQQPQYNNQYQQAPPQNNNFPPQNPQQ